MWTMARHERILFLGLKNILKKNSFGRLGTVKSFCKVAPKNVTRTTKIKQIWNTTYS